MTFHDQEAPCHLCAFCFWYCFSVLVRQGLSPSEHSPWFSCVRLTNTNNKCGQIPDFSHIIIIYIILTFFSHTAVSRIFFFQIGCQFVKQCMQSKYPKLAFSLTRISSAAFGLVTRYCHSLLQTPLHHRPSYMQYTKLIQPMGCHVLEINHNQTIGKNQLQYTDMEWTKKLATTYYLHNAVWCKIKY